MEEGFLGFGSCCKLVCEVFVCLESFREWVVGCKFVCEVFVCMESFRKWVFLHM
jgi:hypothetical protein